MNTYIEHCLVVWKNEIDGTKRTTMEQKIMNILEFDKIKACDYYQVLILATSFEFKPAIVHIFTYNKQLSKKNYPIFLIKIVLFFVDVENLGGLP